MKQVFILLIIVMLSCSGCDRDSSKSIMDDYKTASGVQASSGVSVAVTAEQGCTIEELGLPICWPIREKAISKEYPDLIQRDGKDLAIKLTSGELSDIDIEEGSSVNLVRYFPEVHYGLLSISSAKEATFDAIDMATGERTNVGGDAVLSPDKQRLAIFHQSLVTGSSPNVLAVYVVSAKGIFEEYRVEPDHWGVDDITWVDNKTIAANVVWFDNNVSNHQKQNLRFVGDDIAQLGKWELDPAQPTPDVETRPSESVKKDADQIACSPRILKLGDTLTVKLSLPHGEDFVIVSPDEHEWWLSSTDNYHDKWHETPFRASEFGNLSKIKLDISQLKVMPFVYGKTEPELVFSKPGRYRIVVSENFATDDGTPSYSCFVEFTNKN